ncbi:MAG: DUF3047 domain-containing protein [Planctomycetota bacterium]|nr:MAG: DUF3047 domain-containing protein [Planctomycetota bacterium]
MLLIPKLSILLVFGWLFCMGCSASGISNKDMVHSQCIKPWKLDFKQSHLWVHKDLPGITQKSRYTFQKMGNEWILECKTCDSASLLQFQKPFSPYEYPILAWQWKVTKVYPKGNGLSKEGDDFPLRLVVLFPYNPKWASSAMQWKAKVFYMMHGYYPPLWSLHYVWANRETTPSYFKSPYSSNVGIIALQKGKKNLGLWIQEKISILGDFQRSFGRKLPKGAKAYVAIMADSDNTHEKGISYVKGILLIKNTVKKGKIDAQKN